MARRSPQRTVSAVLHMNMHVRGRRGAIDSQTSALRQLASSDRHLASPAECRRVVEDSDRMSRG